MIQGFLGETFFMNGSILRTSKRRMFMIYNYAFMHEKADELRCAIPKLIEKDSWDEIREMALVPNFMWDGAAAEEYYGYVLSACGRKDARLANYLPEMIEISLQRMNCSDQEVAHMIEQAFASFY